jgi:hypothetical protein
MSRRCVLGAIGTRATIVTQVLRMSLLLQPDYIRVVLARRDCDVRLLVPEPRLVSDEMSVAAWSGSIACVIADVDGLVMLRVPGSFPMHSPRLIHSPLVMECWISHRGGDETFKGCSIFH